MKKIEKFGVKTPEHTPTLQARNKTNSYRLPLTQTLKTEEFPENAY